MYQKFWMDKVQKHNRKFARKYGKMDGLVVYYCLLYTSYLANSSSERYVSVKSGYLALRNAKAFKSSNEVAELYTGDKVQIADSSDSTYWLVYVPGLGKGGYVNKDYLVKNKDNTASVVVTKTVKVKSGYLALRNAKAYDDANEIGQLNNGDTVQVQDSSGSTYWYVYLSLIHI